MNRTFLYVSMVLLSSSALSYELLLGSMASYRYGNPVLQFSLSIGLYLFSMGIGSYLSQYFTSSPITFFLVLELVLAWIGAFSASFLISCFGSPLFPVLLFALVFFIGLCVGTELPLLMHIARQTRVQTKEASSTEPNTSSLLFSSTFAADYIGSLLASFLFPVLFMRHFGPSKTAFLLGISNALMALSASIFFLRSNEKVSLDTLQSASKPMRFAFTFVSLLSLSFFLVCFFFPVFHSQFRGE